MVTARPHRDGPSPATPPGNQESRAAPFGYRCQRCGRCCRDGFRIQLNPYEVARLARHRGVSTTEFRAATTTGGHGSELARTADGTCVLFGADGCSVHADRPLVCRLYPLGRSFGPGSGEAFHHAEAVAGSRGDWRGDGTIATFLDAQGAAPFIVAADAYLAWLNAAMVRLRGLGRGDGDVAAAPTDNGSLLDMDAAIAVHGGDCPPDDIEARKDLHLEILHRHLVPA